jgi:hypothetical protein
MSHIPDENSTFVRLVKNPLARDDGQNKIRLQGKLIPFGIKGIYRKHLKRTGDRPYGTVEFDGFGLKDVYWDNLEGYYSGRKFAPEGSASTTPTSVPTFHCMKLTDDKESFNKVGDLVFLEEELHEHLYKEHGPGVYLIKEKAKEKGSVVTIEETGSFKVKKGMVFD